MKTTKTKYLMKPLLIFTAVLGLAVLGTAIANANDLYNPDLDLIGVGPQVNASPLGWQIIANRSISGPNFSDGADSEPWCNVQQPGGYGLFFKPFQGSTNAVIALSDYITVYFYQDNPSSAGTLYTLSGYASCEASCCLISPPLQPGYLTPSAAFVVEFLDVSGNIIQSNAYDLVSNGMPTAGPGSMAQLTTPQYTAPPGTVTVRAGASLFNAYSTSGAQSFFVDAFDLESTPAPGSPVVTTQPNAATVALGGNAQFTVGTTPTATTNVWLLNNVAVTDVAGHISGSSTATLTITGVTPSDVGSYQAVVSNGSGLNRSQKVPLAISAAYVFPTVSITGPIGDTYSVYSSLNVNGPYTNLVSTVKLTTQPQYVVDYTLPVNTAKYYKAVWSGF